ncbi:MAG TPA: transglutaminase family protein [Candidatus Polarisedimenticolia bacterium]|nr:transglutaminase family protein [Candidatus Polarisedimenticolia bacterium]
MKGPPSFMSRFQGPAGLNSRLALIFYLIGRLSAVDARAQSPSVGSAAPMSPCIPNCRSLEALSGPEVEAEIDRMAEAVRRDIESATDRPTKIQVLNRFFFTASGFRPLREDTPESILPRTVLDRRQGNCLGLSIVYLALARDLDLPVQAVAAPNHLFLRYSDGDLRVNLELLEGGLSHEDDYYLKQYRIPSDSVRRGVFLRSLSDREVLGHVYFSLGANYSKNGDFNSSFALYQAAVRDAPDAPTAHLNLGQDLLARDRAKEAVREFTTALRLYPGYLSALSARSTAQCRLGNLRKARKDLETILDLSPESQSAAKTLAGLECPPEGPH